MTPRLALIAALSGCASTGDACGDMRAALSAQGAALSGVGGGLVGAGAVGFASAAYYNHQIVANAPDDASVDAPVAPYLIAGSALFVGVLVLAVGAVEAYQAGAMEECHESVGHVPMAVERGAPLPTTPDPCEACAVERSPAGRCQCLLDHGGCGNDTNVLRRCATPDESPLTE